VIINSTPINSFNYLIKSSMGIALMLFLTVGEYCYSQTSPSESEAKSDHSWISNGEKLGPWWLKNPKTYQPLPQPLLYHFNGRYSYAETSGNIDAEMHDGTVDLFLRKNLFTSSTMYKVQHHNMDFSLLAMGMKTTNHSFHQQFSFAVTDKLSAVAGLRWDRNNQKYLDKRLIYYGGLLFNLFDSPKFKVSLFGSYGETETAYMSEEVQNTFLYSDFPSVDDYDSDFAYFNQTLNWNITDTVTFSEQAHYGLFLENTDYYFVVTNFMLDFKITKNLSFFTLYEIHYDYSPFTESLDDYLDALEAEGRFVGEINTTDTTLSVGLNFNF